MNDELFHMYQQIIVFMDNIIKIIENDKVDDSDYNGIYHYII